ncbi:chemotaxis protein CheW [Candidatus Woesearchaeota archaeon]|nr:chemotaxis protein CheW [Candidatus Woesearchaeota archaeon]
MSEHTSYTQPLASFEEASDQLVFNEENNINDMYLTFGVATEEYGIGIGYVTEIIGMQRVMEVPDVPAFIKGVINLRGKVIPVMDIRSRFGITEIDYTERTVIVVLDVDNIPLGLIVDSVREVLEIAPDRIDQPPRFGHNREGNGIIRGLGKQGDHVAILLDAGHLMSDQLIDIQSSLDNHQEIDT